MSKPPPKPSDEEDPLYIGPITNAPSSNAAARKKCSMRLHFDYFLQHYWAKTYKGEKKLENFDDLKVDDVTVRLADNFVNYLAFHSRKHCKPDAELLMYNTIDQYLSAFKMNLVKKFFEEEKDLIVNNSAKMALLRKTMLEIKIKQCRKNGSNIMTSLETASKSDIDSFFVLCFWEGTDESAEFLHLMMSCISNCGRGSEVSENN